MVAKLVAQPKSLLERLNEPYATIPRKQLAVDVRQREASRKMEKEKGNCQKTQQRREWNVTLHLGTTQCR